MNELDQLTLKGIVQQIQQIQQKINEYSLLLAEYDRELRRLHKQKQELLSKQYTPSEVKND